MNDDLARLGPLPETMLITVWARARESRRRDGIVRDALAERIIDEVRFDFDRLGDAWKTQIGVAVRTKVMDDLVRDFLARYPDATVVNLGAGLDARHERLDNGRRRWWDLDLPEAMTIRQRWVSATPRHRLRPGCLFDDAWMDELAAETPSRIMFVSEGVLMFHERERVRRLLETLARRFPGAEIVFDSIGGLMMHFPGLHDTLPAFDVRFRSAMRLPRDVDGLGTVTVHPLLREHASRWRWMRVLGHVPYFRRQFTVAHLQCDPRLSAAPKPDRCGHRPSCDASS